METMGGLHREEICSNLCFKRSISPWSLVWGLLSLHSTLQTISFPWIEISSYLEIEPLQFHQSRNSDQMGSFLFFQGWEVLYSFKNKHSGGQVGEWYKVWMNGNGGLSQCIRVAELLKIDLRIEDLVWVLTLLLAGNDDSFLLWNPTTTFLK